VAAIEHQVLKQANSLLVSSTGCRRARRAIQPADLKVACTQHQSGLALAAQQGAAIARAVHKG